ncbi:MAG: sigma-70 family RNA polymerase sigma factor [Planctomycetota bacterium]|jgi:RNA polymerase sigma-70 factor (ECF subfamily)
MTKRQLEELLHHERFLRWLAHRLLRDEARANDVVQDTWLAVLHSSKSPSEVHRGWLAAVLRNLARRKLREEGRRTRREHAVARPDRASNGTCPLETEELRHRLAKLVLDLPEHYRDVVLLRYYDGLEPSEIAMRLDVSPSTIRTRLQRGLDRIRGSLDRSSLSVAPLLEAIVAGRPAARWSLAPAAAAAVLLVASLAALTGSGAAERARGERGAAAATVASATAPATPGARVHETVDAKTPDVAKTESARTLTGRVTLPHGVAHDTVRLELSANGRATRVKDIPAGPFSFDRAGTGLVLNATHPECEPVSRSVAAGPRELTIAMTRLPMLEETFLPPVESLPPPDAAAPEETGPTSSAFVATRPVWLEVTVHLPSDLPREPIQVSIRGSARGLRAWITNGRGSRIDVRPLLSAETSHLEVHAWSQNTVRQGRRIPVWAGPRVNPVVLDLERAARLRGRVQWEGGVAGAGVTVAAVRRVGDRVTPVVAVQADARGAFSLAVPQDSTVMLLALATGAVPVTADATDGATLVLRPGAAIDGRVPDVALRVALAAVTTAPRLVTRAGTLAWTAAGPRWCALSTTANRSGRFRFAGLAPRTYELSCAGETKTVYAPGKVVFAPGHLALAVSVLSAGAPVEGATVTLRDTARETDAHGEASFLVPRAEASVVSVEAKGFQARKIVVPAGRTTRTVELAPVELLGSLVLRVKEQNVPLLSHARVGLERTDRMDAARMLKLPWEESALRIDALPPGAYRYRVEFGGWHFPVEGAVTIAAGARTERVLTPDAGGRLGAADLKMWIRPAAAVDAVAHQVAPRALMTSETAALPADAQPHEGETLLRPGPYDVWFRIGKELRHRTRTVLAGGLAELDSVQAE